MAAAASDAAVRAAASPYENMTSDEVKAKLQRCEFDAAKNPYDFHSPCWLVFNIVRVAVKKVYIGWSVCTKCGSVFKSLSGTSSMQRHIEREHGVVRKNPPEFLKEDVLKALVKYVCKDKVSVQGLDGVGFRDLLQKFLDFGHAHGPLDVNDLLPHRTTVSDHINIEAKKAREKLMPELHAAIVERRSGGTLDTWTTNYTQKHILGFTLSLVTPEFQSRSYNLLMVRFEGAETAENIWESVVKNFAEKYSVTAEDVKKIVMTTDGAQAVLNAMENFDESSYCMDHGLNLTRVILAKKCRFT